MELTFPTTYPVTCHTDYVGPNSVFVAIKGYQTDGVKFISKAIEKGACTIVIEKNVSLPVETKVLIKEKNIAIKRVANARKALAQLSAHYAGYPAKQLKIIGITGTKGKTTTAFLLYHFLKTAGYKTALLSTVCNKIDGIEFPCTLTTAQPDYLHQFFALCVQQNITYVVMEVAAQALSLHRVDGIAFDSVLFTNFSLEHLEFYDSMRAYFDAKHAIIKQVKKDGSVYLNADDEWIQRIIDQHKNSITFGMQQANILFCIDTTIKKQLSFELTFEDKTYQFVCPRLMGAYNAYNCVAACGMALEYRVSKKVMQQALQTFEPIRGRLEKYQLPNGATCIIDYAHNPASFRALFQALRPITDQLIIVFGAAGKRDASRRPLMGKIAADYADVVILTADNPRGENLQTICNDILSGISTEQKKKCIIEFDREQAIKTAYKLSKKNTIIALLGKGPDEYQIMESKKVHFSERHIILQLSIQEHSV